MIIPTLCPTTGDAQNHQAQRAPTYAERQDKINAWTVGLAAGLLEGAPLRLATEMARAVDDRENLHVLPIVTRGPTENLNSLLYLRGVDLAIINSDSLDEYKVAFPDIGRHVAYVLNACELKPLPAGGSLHRLPLRPHRQAAGPRLRPQLEDDQLGRDGAGP
jgi:hypothetical protein